MHRSGALECFEKCGGTLLAIKLPPQDAFANLSYLPTCHKVWLSSSRRPVFAKAGEEAAYIIYGRLVFNSAGWSCLKSFVDHSS